MLLRGPYFCARPSALRVSACLFVCRHHAAPSGASPLPRLAAWLNGTPAEKGTAATARTSSRQIPPAPSPVCSAYLQITSPALSPLPMTVFSSNGRRCHGGVKQGPAVIRELLFYIFLWKHYNQSNSRKWGFFVRYMQQPDVEYKKKKSSRKTPLCSAFGCLTFCSQDNPRQYSGVNIGSYTNMNRNERCLCNTINCECKPAYQYFGFFGTSRCSIAIFPIFLQCWRWMFRILAGLVPLQQPHFAKVPFLH